MRIPSAIRRLATRPTAIAVGGLTVASLWLATNPLAGSASRPAPPPTAAMQELGQYFNAGTAKRLEADWRQLRLLRSAMIEDRLVTVATGQDADGNTRYVFTMFEREELDGSWRPSVSIDQPLFAGDRANAAPFDLPSGQTAIAYAGLEPGRQLQAEVGSRWVSIATPDSLNGIASLGSRADVNAFRIKPQRQ